MIHIWRMAWWMGVYVLTTNEVLSGWLITSALLYIIAPTLIQLHDCKSEWSRNNINACENHLARCNENGQKIKRTKEEVGRQHHGIDKPGVYKSQRAVENSKNWRKLVAKSSTVPQWLSRLSDWWQLWWLHICYLEQNQNSCHIGLTVVLY